MIPSKTMDKYAISNDEEEGITSQPLAANEHRQKRASGESQSNKPTRLRKQLVRSKGGGKRTVLRAPEPQVLGPWRAVERADHSVAPARV